MNNEEEASCYRQAVDRVRAGIGTNEDYVFIEARDKLRIEEIRARAPKYELWLMDKGADCLRCWENEHFEPKGVEVEHLLLFASAYTISDIENGGFIQFFENSTGCLAPEAINGLKLMDASPAAEVIIKAMQIFGSSYPRERQIRVDKLLDRSSDAKLERLTDEFYEANQNFPEKVEQFYRQVVERVEKG
jgi:hypothetical protein